MSRMFFAQRPVMLSVALVALAACTTGAEAATDVSISDAKIAGGKLTISGAAAPGSWLRLDGQAGAEFSVKSGADGTFEFGVLYHPGDCIIDVQRLLSPAQLGPATQALVSGCAPRALTGRGAWEAGADYLAEDVVSAKGTSWRAKRGSIGSPPAAGSLDWEQFAAKANPLSSGSEPDAGIAATPDGPAGGDLTGTYPNPLIANSAVTTNKIANDAVTTGKIPLLAITTNRIAADAIITNRIADLAVTAAKLASDAVTSSKLANGAVVTAKLALNAVTGDRIADGAITQADLATNSVGSTQIQADAVQATEIADSSVDSGEIANNSLFAEDLAANSVGNSELQDNAVSTENIIASTITGADVANNSLTTADIAGTDSNGAISLVAGSVANGRCKSYDITVGGAVTGDVIVISTRAALPAGLVIYGQQAPADGHGIMTVCNLSGATMPALTDFPIRTITFR